MRPHDGALDLPVLGTRETHETRERGEGLHPKLTHEPRETLPQDLEGLTPIPYPPVMALAEAQRLGSPPVRRVGATLDIGAEGIVLAELARDELTKETHIVPSEELVGLLGVLLLPAPVLHGFTYLIIATPHCDRGLGAQTTDVVHELSGDIAEEGIVPGVGRTGKHEVLPEEDPPLIG